MKPPPYKFLSINFCIHYYNAVLCWELKNLKDLIFHIKT